MSYFCPMYFEVSLGLFPLHTALTCGPAISLPVGALLDPETDVQRFDPAAFTYRALNKTIK